MHGLLRVHLIDLYHIYIYIICQIPLYATCIKWESISLPTYYMLTFCVFNASHHNTGVYKKEGELFKVPPPLKQKTIKESRGGQKRYL